MTVSPEYAAFLGKLNDELEAENKQLREALEDLYAVMIGEVAGPHQVNAAMAAARKAIDEPA